MADADFTFNPDITITPDDKLVVTGTVDPAVSDLQIIDARGGAVLNLVIKSDGTWSASETFDPSVAGVRDYAAHFIDASGQAQTVDQNTGVITGEKGYPFSSEEVITSTDRTDLKLGFYSANGTLNSHMDWNKSSDTMTERGDHSNAHFVFFPTADGADDMAEKVTNFHLGSKYSHDTLYLAHQDFANMADLLRQTSMVGGNAVIHEQNGYTLTLAGVTKTEMKAHPSDFSFHGPLSVAYG